MLVLGKQAALKFQIHALTWKDTALELHMSVTSLLGMKSLLEHLHIQLS